MAESRMIRIGILTSERVNVLSWEEEVFYRRLMSIVDDYGRHDARVSILRCQLYPLKLDKMSEASIQRCLASCEAARLVRLYFVECKPYVEVLDFRQRTQGKSKCPPPDQVDVGGGALDDSTVVHGGSRWFTAKTETETETETLSESKTKTNSKDEEGEVSNTVDVVPKAGCSPPPPKNDDDLHARTRSFVRACCSINPAWSKTILNRFEASAAENAYNGGAVSARDVELVAAYYRSRLAMDSRRVVFWRPDGRAKFFECFGDILAHAMRWAKEARWKSGEELERIKRAKAVAKAREESKPVEESVSVEEFRKSLGADGGEGA